MEHKSWNRQKMKLLKEFNFAFICVVALLIWGCGPSKPYQAKYEAAWLEVVKSEAWKESIRQTQSKDELFEASTSDDTWLTENNEPSGSSDQFQNGYDTWVRKAYYKIISEAEDADTKIKAEYDRFVAENPEAADSEDENVVRILALYKKKYKAHETMLSGLKAWNAFDDFGSDDLKFFKLENEGVARSMYNRGLEEDRIVDYLVYKLADLYHLDSDLAD